MKAAQRKRRSSAPASIAPLRGVHAEERVSFCTSFLLEIPSCDWREWGIDHTRASSGNENCEEDSGDRFFPPEEKP